MHKTLFYFLFVTMLIVLISCSSCNNRSTAIPPISSSDSIHIINEILGHRQEMDVFFRSNPASPFLQDTTARFDSIKWFPPSLEYYFRSQLFRYAKPQEVNVFGTKGEKRNALRYGYFKIEYEGNEYRLNTYKTLPSQDDPSPDPMYLSVWFTDASTGKETYGVGRYVDIGEEQSDENAIYVIDMNKAYNPYCAYSSIYSCAVPRKEDRFDFPILAGEKKYHE